MLYCQGEDLETRDFNVIWIGYQKVTWRRRWPTWNVIGFNNRIGTWEIERSLRCKRMRRRRRTRRRRGGPSLWLTWIFPRLHRHSCRPEGMQRPHHLQHHHHYRQRGFATAASSPSQLQKNIFCWGQMIHTRTKKIFSFFFFGPFSVDGMYETFIFCHFFQSNILLAKNHSTKKWQKMHPLSMGEYLRR